MSNIHTPGPWNAIKGDTFNPDRSWGVSKYLSLEECQLIDGDDATYPSRTVVIAEVCDGPTAERDAVLLAAAPDLLAALIAIRDAALNMRGEWVVTKDITGKTLEPMFIADDLAQAAIAKAVG